MKEENKVMTWINFLRELTIPDWVVNNVILALGKGIFGLVTEATNLPKNYLSNINQQLLLKGEIRRDFLKKASEEYLPFLNGNPDLAERALKSNGIKLIEEQINKDNIAIKTFDILQDPNSIKRIGTEKQEINPDWLTAFWNLAATKTDKDVQEILSKILADEILKPKSISLHTLQTLSILTSKIGESFSRLSNLSIDDNDSVFVIHPHVFSFQKIGPLDDYNISFNDLLDLDGAGLIRSTETITIQYGESKIEEVDYAGKSALLDISGKQLKLIFFTNAGKELRRLLTLEPIDNYTQEISRILGDSFQVKKEK
ncbi:MAG: DUF2806 domain-containing protein [Saprospiraceae bacterium]|nr:DUF2806 domain-containing protein [Saprospiraceae bacterium]MCF8250931.1 DUF2806 domain-containing protein [Saprospiraceae bacterium]MCF8281909.1 DUF2806 domain-containing protein [Bacteroidales bacterium]MCF8311896.1 DUF2806 domain-containing protein [Saprospiraceae bacterium]MCF8441904.1 DUF2806 domain-containing protein [Saprospiraceae bacterium]